MIRFTQGNLLETDAEAIVNTVNTVGVMGKGIALMFKEAYPENFKAYEAACKAKHIALGRMFVTEQQELLGPKWIINFPTKAHWRFPSKLEWIEDGLRDLASFIVENKIRSIALPPLGAGNGGLDWRMVRQMIENALGSIPNVEVIVYEPTPQYQNVSKRTGTEKLTPARALVAELVRRYLILGIDCTLLEVQKLGYFLDRFNQKLNSDTFQFAFTANKYGPYSEKLKHMLNDLDGSYLRCDKRLGDAGPFDAINFQDQKREKVAVYIGSGDAKLYRPVLEATSNLIDGFESPLGMELLATVDWLVCREGAAPEVSDVKKKLAYWAGGPLAAERKLKLFEDRTITLAIEALREASLIEA